MKVLHDKSVLDPATLDETRRTEVVRKLHVKCEAQWRQAVPVVVLHEPAKGIDPRWAALERKVK